jgi:hypothetical protein
MQGAAVLVCDVGLAANLDAGVSHFFLLFRCECTASA